MLRFLFEKTQSISGPQISCCNTFLKIRLRPTHLSINTISSFSTFTIVCTVLLALVAPLATSCCGSGAVTLKVVKSVCHASLICICLSVKMSCFQTFHFCTKLCQPTPKIVVCSKVSVRRFILKTCCIVFLTCYNQACNLFCN